MCSHVRFQGTLCLKSPPAHFTRRTGRPRRGLWGLLLARGGSAATQTCWLLELVHDEEVAGHGGVRGVAEATLAALEGRAVGAVLGDVLVEAHQVLCAEVAHAAAVHLAHAHFQLLQRLSS